MSQEKVERYKEEKANRKKNLAKQKFQSKVKAVVGTIACLAVAAGIGYLMYTDVQSKKPADKYYCDTKAVTEYISGLSTEAK